jgi:hypothetical protein
VKDLNVTILKSYNLGIRSGAVRVVKTQMLNQLCSVLVVSC